MALFPANIRVRRAWEVAPEVANIWLPFSRTKSDGYVTDFESQMSTTLKATW
ncbi:hypothetical protein AB0G15_36870 [Streptosporangium sp. NPDC023825]|uniref:hypothetical protein n=1 Tax=Streptosporangium sp. NPDC023825 TaxID=3154909 RepID=UPI00343A576B